MDNLKYTGIVRRVDDLGRIQIPKEIRQRLKIAYGDPLEMILTDDGLFMKPYNDKSLSDEDIFLLDKAKNMLKAVYGDEKDIDALFNKIL